MPGAQSHTSSLLPSRAIGACSQTNNHTNGTEQDTGCGCEGKLLETTQFPRHHCKGKGEKNGVAGLEGDRTQLFREDFLAEVLSELGTARRSDSQGDNKSTGERKNEKERV